jgi:hypothetical protein
VLFFEKKNQKTFVRLVPRTLTHVTVGRGSATAKVFCFVFSKNKYVFSCVILVGRVARRRWAEAHPT